MNRRRSSECGRVRPWESGRGDSECESVRLTRGSASEVCPIKSGRVRPWTRGVRREVRPMGCGRGDSQCESVQLTCGSASEVCPIKSGRGDSECESVRLTRGVRRKVRPMGCGRVRPWESGRGDSECESVRCASRDSRAIHRIGRDAGNCVAQTERGGFRSSSLGDKLHPCQSIASRLAIARGICARFPAVGGRLALSVRGKSAALCARLWRGDGEAAGLGRLESHRVD